MMSQEDEASAREARLRRVAVQVVALLPESPEEAMTALNYAAELVEGFLKPGSGSAVVRLHSIRGNTSALRGRHNQ